jgi:hypothetical protein
MDDPECMAPIAATLPANGGCSFSAGKEGASWQAQMQHEALARERDANSTETWSDVPWVELKSTVLVALRAAESMLAGPPPSMSRPKNSSRHSFDSR